MLTALVLCLLTPETVTLSYQTSEAPQGFRFSSVTMERRGNYGYITIKGRYSGFDKGTVYFDLTLKKGSRVVATDRDYVKLVPRQPFERTFSLRLSEDIDGARAHFKFGEIRVE